MQTRPGTVRASSLVGPGAHRRRTPGGRRLHHLIKTISRASNVMVDQHATATILCGIGTNAGKGRAQDTAVETQQSCHYRRSIRYSSGGHLAASCIILG